MASLIDRVKRALGQIVIPVFAVDDTPPAFEDGDVRPAQLDKTTGGIKVHIVGDDIGGSGGGGDATAANQVLGLAALDQIYDALALVGTEATSTQILAAVQGLGDGATLADLATALLPLADAATEATQQSVLAALQSQGVDIGVIKASVATLVTNTDQLEALLAAIQLGTDKIPTSPAQDRTTAGAPVATRASDGTNS